EQADALFVILLALLELRADAGVGDLPERLPVGLDGGDLAPEQSIQLADHVFVGSCHVGLAPDEGEVRTCTPPARGGTARLAPFHRPPGRAVRSQAPPAGSAAQDPAGRGGVVSTGALSGSRSTSRSVTSTNLDSVFRSTSSRRAASLLFPPTIVSTCWA